MIRSVRLYIERTPRSYLVDVRRRTSSDHGDYDYHQVAVSYHAILTHESGSPSIDLIRAHQL